MPFARVSLSGDKEDGEEWGVDLEQQMETIQPSAGCQAEWFAPNLELIIK